MGNNTFTELFADGVALTQTQLETALQTLKPDISNTTGMTTGSTSGQFLKSNGDGLAASFASVPDPLGPFALRNYGLSTSVSTGNITVSLKTNAGSDPSATDKVNLTFSNNGTTSAAYSAVDVSSALSLQIKGTSTLGAFAQTSANRVYIYALNNAGTPILGASYSSTLDKGVAVTTNTGVYSVYLQATASLTVVPRLLGWFDAVRSGTAWQTPTKVAVTQQNSFRQFPRYGSGSYAGLSSQSLTNGSYTTVNFDTNNPSTTTDTYWTNSNATRVLVPTGARMIKLKGQVLVRSVLNTNNGVVYNGGYTKNSAGTGSPTNMTTAFIINSNGSNTLTITSTLNFTSPPIEVVDGDYFEIRIKYDDINSGNTCSIAPGSSLSIEVLA